MTELTGGCLCGGVRYRIAGEPFMAVNCHCSMCRRAHGAAFRSGAFVHAQNFAWTRGEDLLADYRSSAEIHRLFCKVCGSHVVARSDSHPAIVSVAVGTLDGAPPVRLAAHWNVASKAPWFEITDALPQHAVLPPR